MANDKTPVFETVRPWLDGEGWTPARIAALNSALERFRAAAGVPEKAPPRRASAEGVALIHSFESFRSNAYPDPGSRDGKPVTIGWGSTRDEQGRPVNLGDTWTRERADAVFAAQLARYEDGVAAMLGDAPTTQGQFDALVSFAYNVGLRALEESTLLRKHKAGDHAGAEAEFARRSGYVGGPAPVKPLRLLDADLVEQDRG